MSKLVQANYLLGWLGPFLFSGLIYFGQAYLGFKFLKDLMVKNSCEAPTSA